VSRLFRSAAVSACAALLVAAGPQAAHAAPDAGTAACTGTVQIVSFAFDPAGVTAGQTSTAHLVLQSCTGQSQQDQVQWYGLFSGNGTGFPAGCPAIDPVILPAPVPATGQSATAFTFSVPPSCTATSLRATATVRGADGSTLATGTATLAISGTAPPPPTCSVRYVRQGEWSGGFVAVVTTANGGGTALTGWTLVFTFGGDQTVTGAWGATVTQSGATVTARNVAWDATVPAGGTVTFGIQGSWHTSDAPPASFALNGGACTAL
jgi:cellulase/cellobiase CelA1